MAEPSCKLCFKSKSELKDKLAELKSTIEKIKRAQAVAMEICCEKDKKIRLLESSIPREIVATDAVEAHHSSEAKSTVEKIDSVMNVPNKYFSSDQLKVIQSVGMSTLEDSTFILNVVRFLYAADLKVLEHTTIKGKGRNGQKKEMSHENKNIISHMFSERLQQIGEEDRKSREKKMNMLIRRAITNINALAKKINNAT